MEKERFPLSEYSALTGGDFQGIWVYRSDVFWKERERRTAAPMSIVSMSPPGYPLGMVASLQSPLPFHPAKSL